MKSAYKTSAIVANNIKPHKFPWHPPKTISQRMADYLRPRFMRPDARYPLPEDIERRKKPR